MPDFNSEAAQLAALNNNEEAGSKGFKGGSTPWFLPSLSSSAGSGAIIPSTAGTDLSWSSTESQAFPVLRRALCQVS